MERLGMRGFSLIELAMVVMLLGIVLAMSVPAYNGFRKSHELKGATLNIAAQIRLAREKAISTGVCQTFHTNYGWSDSDYHIHPGCGTSNGAKWKLPRGVTYYGTTYPEYRMQRDGRSMDSGMIILQNTRGQRDTVSVMVSGLVLVK
jgi:prepilin-type N-terminal cleavage/methylation domain-containing protein